MKQQLPLLITALVLMAQPSYAEGPDPDFSSYWHDGRAELDGYRWTVDRYGQARDGQCVMIYVTEPFSRTKHVKVDDSSRNPSDTFDALKLNLVRDFQTGIYDYNTMVSVFVRSDDFAPSKISFSSAEWCGHVYDELVFDDGTITWKYFSYFEDESAARELVSKESGIAEDNFFILLRGLRGPFLSPGEKRSFPFLPSSFYGRLAHRPVAWGSAEIHRLKGTQEIKVPAGTFSADVYEVTTSDEREGRFFVERAYPHRILRWKWESVASGRSPGGTDSGELTGTQRLEYWNLHDNGHESYLEKLGLKQP